MFLSSSKPMDHGLNMWANISLWPNLYSIILPRFSNLKQLGSSGTEPCAIIALGFLMGSCYCIKQNQSCYAHDVRMWKKKKQQTEHQPP